MWGTGDQIQAIKHIVIIPLPIGIYLPRSLTGTEVPGMTELTDEKDRGRTNRKLQLSLKIRIEDWYWVLMVSSKLQALVYDILPSTTAVFSYAIGPRKLSANEQFFVGAQTVVSLLQTTQIISDVCFVSDHVAYPSSNKTTIVSVNRDGPLFFFFLTRGGCASCLRACLGARFLPQSYQYPNLSEGADRVGGQLRGDKECHFSGVTKSGRVWRKVPESGARSVGQFLSYQSYNRSSS